MTGNSCRHELILSLTPVYKQSKRLRYYFIISVSVSDSMSHSESSAASVVKGPHQHEPTIFHQDHSEKQVDVLPSKNQALCCKLNLLIYFH